MPKLRRYEDTGYASRLRAENSALLLKQNAIPCEIRRQSLLAKNSTENRKAITALELWTTEESLANAEQTLAQWEKQQGFGNLHFRCPACQSEEIICFRPFAPYWLLFLLLCWPSLLLTLVVRQRCLDCGKKFKAQTTE